MNVPVTPEDSMTTAAPEGPGKQLRAMREAQGLDLSQIASQLHLSESVLQSLEADNYDSMAGTVFVQGYLRNYARLLGVDAVTVLESFDTSRPERDPLADLSVAKVKHEVRSSHLFVRMVTWLIVIGLIVLLVVWWRGYLQWPLQMDELVGEFSDTGAEVTEPVDDTEADNDPSVPVFNVPPEALGNGDAGVSSESVNSSSAEASSDAIEPTPAAEATPDVEPSSPQSNDESPASETMDTEATTPVKETAEIKVATELAPAVSLPLVEVPEVEEAPQVASLPSATPATAEVVAEESAANVVISFSGPCWVDVKGADGSYRWFGNQKAGGELVLGGKAPYKLLLGNAAVASIKVDGKEFDLAAHSRANVARFTLELN